MYAKIFDRCKCFAAELKKNFTFGPFSPNMDKWDAERKCASMSSASWQNKLHELHSQNLRKAHLHTFPFFPSYDTVTLRRGEIRVTSVLCRIFHCTVLHRRRRTARRTTRPFARPFTNRFSWCTCMRSGSYRRDFFLLSVRPALFGRSRLCVEPPFPLQNCVHVFVGKGVQHATYFRVRARLLIASFSTG